MSNVQYATFVKNEFQLIAALLSLRSLQLLECCAEKPLVLVPKPLVAEIEEKYPKLKIQNLVRKLDGDMKSGFANGFNPRNSFRAALGNLARKTGSKPMLYFSPNTIFFKNPEAEMTIADVVAARSPDQYWPTRELYGPKTEEIWGEIAKFAGAEIEPWLNQSFSKEYWRRYPCASTQLIYTNNAAKFAEEYTQLSKSLISAKLPALEGQGRDLVEPTIAAAVMNMGGKIVDINWDDSVVPFDNFPQLVLRMRATNVEKFETEVIGFPRLRNALKKIHEHKIVFYHNALKNVREKFDDVEQEFTLLRMNTLIERRKLDKKVKRLIRAAKKAELENEASD